MKKLKLLFLVLAIPITGYSQFIVNYNPNSNILNVTYTGCDICLLGNVTAVDICNCREDCDLDCVNFCHTNNTTITAVEYCIQQCQMQEAQCLEECGPEPEPVREIVGYRYRLLADWAAIPLDPRATPANRVMTPFTTVLSSTISIPSWTVPAPWPEIHSGNNTCYGIEIVIEYNDGALCGGIIWECNIIG